MRENNEFDFQQALQDIQAGKPLLGKGGFFTPLIKKLTEAALEDELDTPSAGKLPQPSNRQRP